MSAGLDSQPARPPVLRTAWRAWCSTADAMRAMPLAFLATVAAATVFAYALSRLAGPDVAQPAPDPATLGDGVVRFLTSFLPLSFVNALVVAPLAVAMHRFVVLGEHRSLLPLRPLSRVLRYAVWVTAFEVCRGLPTLLATASTPARFLAVGLTLVAIVATVRLTLLFPQVAVDGAGVPLRRLWAATRWRFWNTVAVLFVTLVPIAVVQLAIAAAIFYVIGAANAVAAAAYLVPLSSVLIAVDVALAAAAASWLYIGHGLSPAAHLGEHLATG